MRILFMGTPEFARTALFAIREAYPDEIVGVITRQDTRRLLRHLPATAAAPRCRRSCAFQLPPAPCLQRLCAVPALPIESLPPPPPPPSPLDACAFDAASTVAGARAQERRAPGPIRGRASASDILGTNSLGFGHLGAFGPGGGGISKLGVGTGSQAGVGGRDVRRGQISRVLVMRSLVATEC